MPRTRKSISVASTMAAAAGYRALAQASPADPPGAALQHHGEASGHE
ncbi:hypothetical protein ACX80I_11310 [Arthrobacter sp. MDT3-44]